MQNFNTIGSVGVLLDDEEPIKLYEIIGFYSNFLLVGLIGEHPQNPILTESDNFWVLI
tara:strand:+ start:598 stop:771 length:174 start_codon:yes stop_codon:yes gene_type:complete